MNTGQRWIISGGAVLFCGAGFLVNHWGLYAQTPQQQMQARRAVTLLAPEFGDDRGVASKSTPAASGFPVQRRPMTGAGMSPQELHQQAQSLEQRRAATGVRRVQGTSGVDNNFLVNEVTDPPLPGAMRPSPGNPLGAPPMTPQPRPMQPLNTWPAPHGGPMTEYHEYNDRGPLSSDASRYVLPEVGRPFTSVVSGSDRANSAEDAGGWLAPYEDRARRAPMQESTPGFDEPRAVLPLDYRGWWEQPITQPLRDSGEQLPVNVDLLVTGSLEFSPQLLAIKTDPNVRYSRFLAEDAAFDWTAFVESRWDHTNEPVGSTLTTGTASSRFNDRNLSSKGGIRRKNEYGGQVELSQKFGWQDNNSRFLKPDPQGTSRLELNYTQPLMNGAGVPYNTGRIVLAQIDTNIAHDKVVDELQTHLLKVTEAYWELYRARAVFLQRKRLLGSALMIRDTLHGRQDIDAQQRQVLRGDAAVASRRSEIIRAAAAIRNAESRLRLLVNDPGILDVGHLELIPEEAPIIEYVPLSLSGALQSALIHRPDISQAIRELRASSVRIGVAENELLPRLDLVLRTYVSGLEGDSNIPRSWGDQFSQGAPSYGIGILYEVPLGNRAAQARYEARKWEYSRAVQEFRAVVETGMTEVELAVREAETSYREMLGKYQALAAAENEASYLDSRWGVLAGDGRGTTVLLEDLLSAQERLVDAEGDFVQSQVNYVVALSGVRRATGTLLHVADGSVVPSMAPAMGGHHDGGQDAGEYWQSEPVYRNGPIPHEGSYDGPREFFQEQHAPSQSYQHAPNQSYQHAPEPTPATLPGLAPGEMRPIPQQPIPAKPVPVENGPLFEDPPLPTEGPLVPPGPQARTSRFSSGPPVIPVSSTRTSVRTVFP